MFKDEEELLNYIKEHKNDDDLTWHDIQDIVGGFVLGHQLPFRKELEILDKADKIYYNR